MEMIEAAFGAFAVAGLLLFRLLTPAHAAAATCVAGWLILPVGNYPEGSAAGGFPFWIAGAALPSDMLLTKMWLPPVVALAGALLTDRPTLARFRPAWVDVPMLLWCLWPLGQWIFIAAPAPRPWIAALYLAAAWGASWLLGRIYFFGAAGGARLAVAMVAGLALIAPVAAIEGVMGPQLYAWIYEPHPFWADGKDRYVGFRPLAFFEHGNQYGIWAAATALAAIWLWRTAESARTRGLGAAVAALALIVVLASQSAGAIVLLCLGLALLWAIGRPLMRWALPLALLLTAIGGAVYLTGALPLRQIAEKTAIGRQIVHVVRASGRGSFAWRIARDQIALAQIGKNPALGTGQWDWWRKNRERPWGLAFLVIGQYGLIGLALAFGALLLPALRALWSSRAAPRAGADSFMAVLVLIALADALLNSFFFYPALLAAGALAAMPAARPPAGTIG